MGKRGPNKNHRWRGGNKERLPRRGKKEEGSHDCAAAGLAVEVTLVEQKGDEPQSAGRQNEAEINREENGPN